MQIFGPEDGQVSFGQIKEFMSLRKSYFVDSLDWNISHTLEYEWDEYDTPHAKYIVIFDKGKCVGGLRLLPTTNVTPDFMGGNATFMINDFINGRIDVGIRPDDITHKIPSGEKVWEMTRFIGTTPEVTTALLERANEFLSQISAELVLTISPALMPRVLKRLGYSCSVLSNKLTFDGKNYVILATEVEHDEVRMIA